MLYSYPVENQVVMFLTLWKNLLNILCFFHLIVEHIFIPVRILLYKSQGILTSWRIIGFSRS